MRAPSLVLLTGSLALVCAAGCGLKSPLYLPTAEQERETAERERALQERERREQEAEKQPPPASTQPPAQSAPAGAPAN